MKQDELETIIKPILNDLDLILWGLEYLPQGRHALLRIFIDKDSGVNLHDCERASKSISAQLDVEDPISTAYKLEVSSPGLPRPLFYIWQYKQYINHEVEVKLFTPLNGKRKLIGTIESADADTLCLSTEDENINLTYSNIVKAHLTSE